jgi:hypothetical protein
MKENLESKKVKQTKQESMKELKQLSLKISNISHTPPPMKIYNKMIPEVTPFDSFLTSSNGKQVNSKFFESKTDNLQSDYMPNFDREYDFLVDIIKTTNRDGRLSLDTAESSSSSFKKADTILLPPQNKTPTNSRIHFLDPKAKTKSTYIKSSNSK